MEEVADPGEDDHRQELRPRPGERGRERHDVVDLAVQRPRCRRAPSAPPASRSTGRPAPGGAACRPRAAGRRRSRRRSRRRKSRRAPTAGQRSRSRPRIAATTASASSTSPRPSSHVPSERPMPRKLKRTLVQPSCRKVRASICTTLLSSVPPNCGCGWQTTATPRGAVSGRSMAHSMRPAGPAMSSRTVRGFMASRGSVADVGRQQQALDDLALLQVRVDDLVDVGLVDVGVPGARRDRPRRPGRRRSGPGSPTC